MEGRQQHLHVIPPPNARAKPVLRDEDRLLLSVRLWYLINWRIMSSVRPARRKEKRQGRLGKGLTKLVL